MRLFDFITSQRWACFNHFYCKEDVVFETQGPKGPSCRREGGRRLLAINMKDRIWRWSSMAQTFEQSWEKEVTPKYLDYSHADFQPGFPNLYFASCQPHNHQMRSAEDRRVIQLSSNICESTCCIHTSSRRKYR